MFSFFKIFLFFPQLFFLAVFLPFLAKLVGGARGFCGSLHDPGTWDCKHANKPRSPAGWRAGTPVTPESP